MSQIKISNLSFAYDGSYDYVFENIHLKSTDLEKLRGALQAGRHWLKRASLGQVSLTEDLWGIKPQR